MDIKVDKYKSELTVLINDFYEASKEVKTLEIENTNIIIPTINQLRNVAFHLVKAIESKKEKETLVHIIKAKDHSTRAKYDIYETRLIFYLRNIENFKRRYSSRTETVTVLPEYINMSSRIEEIKDFYSNNVKETFSDREMYYKNIKSNIDELKGFSRKFDESVPLIQKKIIENGQVSVFSLLAIIIGIIGLYLTVK